MRRRQECDAGRQRHTDREADTTQVEKGAGGDGNRDGNGADRDNALPGDHGEQPGRLPVRGRL